MKKSLFCAVVVLLFLLTSCNQRVTEVETQVEQEKLKYALVIHGGAGTILKKNMTLEREKQYLDALNQALNIGESILKENGSAIDAVERTIMYLEDSPLFNAGRGAVFTNEGKNELDASIMQGVDMNAGAVGGLNRVKNPIRAARAVLERSDHVLLTSSGADLFAESVGLEMVDPQYFYTDRRWESLQRIKESEKTELSETDEDKKHGTVGCVALDSHGNLVAGTSTGGMTNKRFNRFGDVPIIGAGTYADNSTCAVSCTGHGEFFIRYAVAHDVSARMKYLNESLLTSANHVVNKTLVEAGGSGGLIAVDRFGNVAMPFNSAGMYRGYVTPKGRDVAIYKNE